MVFSWYSVAVMLLAFYQSTPKMSSHFPVRNGQFHLLSSGEWTRAQWNHQWISHFWPWIGRRAADDVAVHGWTWDIALRNLGIHQPPSSFFVWGVAPTLLRKKFLSRRFVRIWHSLPERMIEVDILVRFEKNWCMCLEHVLKVGKLWVEFAICWAAVYFCLLSLVDKISAFFFLSLSITASLLNF